MKMRGNFVIYFLVWISLFVLLVFGFNRWHQANFSVQSKTVVNHTEKTLILSPGRDNHFRLKALVNGVEMTFLVDTGASKVAIPESLAKQANLIKRYPIVVSTANGKTQGFLTRIKLLQLGAMNLHNISAIIMPQESGIPLLGMSALSKLTFKYQGQQLILKQ